MANGKWPQANRPSLMNPVFSLVSRVMKWFEGRADDPFRNDE